MVDFLLVGEKSTEELNEETGGSFPVGREIMSGTVGVNGSEKFSVSRSGDRLYFQFENGKRIVSGDIFPLIIEAYNISRT